MARAPLAHDARPFFPGIMVPERNIRGSWADKCDEYPPAPSIPVSWYDGGLGWTTRYFRDVVPFSQAAQAPGTHACKLQRVTGGGAVPCDFVVENNVACSLPCGCWQAGDHAVTAMAQHLVDAHGVQPPRKGQWAVGLCECNEALCDVCCCAPCSATRQWMALYGYHDRFSCVKCTNFTFTICFGGSGLFAFFGHIIGACCTRFAVKRMFHVQENDVATCCIALLFPWCSLAQTHTHITTQGVWPGATLCHSEPAVVGTGVRLLN